MKVEMLNDDITLYCGDCIEIMSGLPDNSFDMILSDYPFNCQDGRKDYEKFVQDTELLFSQKAKDVCNMVVINNPAKIFTTTPFFQNWTLVNGIALIRRGSLRPAWHWGYQHNYMLVLNKGGIKNKWNGTKVNHDKDFDTDVIQYQNGYRGNGGDWHPQAIPLDLTKKLVGYLSDEYDSVLDPFMGSGTTGVACAQTGRKFIGIEIDESYFDMSCRRIQKLLLQPRLL